MMGKGLRTRATLQNANPLTTMTMPAPSAVSRRMPSHASSTARDVWASITRRTPPRSGKVTFVAGGANSRANQSGAWRPAL